MSNDGRAYQSSPARNTSTKVKSSKRIAVIGSGVSGIAAAKVLVRLGHEVIVFEKAPQIGGVWVLAYEQVRLQNVALHYRFTDFDWPNPVDEHPTTAQVLSYLEAAVVHYDLDVRPSHEVMTMSELADGWQLEIRTTDGLLTERFDQVVVAAGLFSGEPAEMKLDGLDAFQGRVLSERTLGDLSDLAGKRVSVIGFGKTAVDLATMAAEHGAIVNHIFRVPRWLLPRRVLGRNLADIAAARMSTTMTPSWVHINRREAIVHKYFPWAVAAYWKGTEWLFKAVLGLHQFYGSADIRARMAMLKPGQDLTYQMRAAAALAPDTYFPLVRSGAIIPYQGNATGYSKTGLVMSDGNRIDADVVIAAVGYRPPDFNFLPDKYRKLMTSEQDGTQLYRHVLHPQIPHLAFAGYNHCYMHIPGVEIAMLWYGAVIDGRVSLPTLKEMTACVDRIAAWKREHSLFEPTRAYGVGGRFHHYLDVMLEELGVRANRKSNALSDHFLPYLAEDYAGVFEEYEKLTAKSGNPRTSLNFDA